MTATHKPFKSASLVYNEIHNYIKNHTSAAKPTTINELYDKCKNAKNRVQVSDAVKKLRSDKLVAAIREGMELKLWWAANNGAGNANLGFTPKQQTPVYEPLLKPADIPMPVRDIEETLDRYFPREQVTEAQPVDMPEVNISKTAITITAGGVKITIER